MRKNWWWLPHDLGEALAAEGVDKDKARNIIEHLANNIYFLPRSKSWRDRWIRAAMRQYSGGAF